MSWYDKHFEDHIDPRLPKWGAQWWGDNYFLDKVGDIMVRNYFMAEADQNSVYALPFVKAIK
jgi:hypothetical protein